jgi:hypothetical protein
MCAASHSVVHMVAMTLKKSVVCMDAVLVWVPLAGLAHSSVRELPADSCRPSVLHMCVFGSAVIVVK